MSDNDTYNCRGLLLFGASFVGLLVFFLWVLGINPGAIDTGAVVPVRFSKQDADSRTSQWKQVTPENVAYGKDIYSVNCASCHAQIVAFKHGNTPLALYRSVRNGFDNTHRFDFVPEREKWAVVAYVRSMMKSAPDDSKSDWDKFLEQGSY